MDPGDPHGSRRAAGGRRQRQDRGAAQQGGLRRRRGREAQREGRAAGPPVVVRPHTATPPMRVRLVAPSAFTPPYDHALSAALARAGADVELVTSRFGYGAVPRPDGNRVSERFYRWAPGAPGSRARF